MQNTFETPRAAGCEPQHKRAGAFFISIALELALVVCVLIGAVMNFRATGFGMLQFYTVDSNLLAMGAALVSIIYKLVCAAKKTEVPRWVGMLKYMALSCLAVTFFTVLLVLAPMYGLKGYIIMFFSRDMLYHHFICPILAAVSFFLFDMPVAKPKRAAAAALVPTLAYAVVAICLNLTRTIEGPYPFLRVYEQSVWTSVMWCVLITLGAYGLALLLARLKSRQSRDRSGASVISPAGRG